MAQAEQASLRALELDPELAEAHAARGAVLFLTDRIDHAEREFQTAIRLDPRLFDAHYLYARCCFQSGRLEHAARLFEQALAVQENYQAAFFAAQSREALGSTEAADHYRRALEIVERHMELNPDDPRAATMRAVSLCRLGRTGEGVHWGEQAIEIDPEDASVRYNVACLFAVAGEPDRAIGCLEDALRVGFGNTQWLRQDPDLASLRGNPRFEALLAEHDQLVPAPTA
jgi:tetratricopeptide (TPR) repeat protein